MNPERARELLEKGHVEVIGRMPYSSNATYLVETQLDGTTLQAIYKPERGERPLWDFPPGLYRREVASYELSRALGWGLVPTTVLWCGPMGIGSAQVYIEADPDEHYFTMLEDPGHHEALRQLCTFDLLANSADRKSGHCLLTSDRRLQAIDNGLTFHHELKLRTVIWDFAGERISDDLLDDIADVFGRGAPREMHELLDDTDVAALERRARAVLDGAHFPHDTSGRRYPWPLV